METEHFRSSSKYSGYDFFPCTVTEAANGIKALMPMCRRRMPVSQDDAEVYVNTAVLSIEKVFRIHIWQPGRTCGKMNFG